MTLARTLHKFASPFLYASGLYQNRWRAHARRKPFAFVAFYHRVVAANSVKASAFNLEKGISAEDFERQMRFLCRHFKAVKASRIQSELGREICFAVTLDDGYEDNYLVAAPILKKLGIPATFYVVSDFVGSDRLFWWEQIADLFRRSHRQELDMSVFVPDLDGARLLPMRSHAERSQAYETLCAAIRNGRHVDIPQQMKRAADFFELPLREQGRDYGLMDWRQLKNLVVQGFEIGGHTATHCNLIGADEAMLRRELNESMRTIETELDAPVESFAYPYGLFETSSELVTSALSRTNCRAAFTVLQGAVHAGAPAFELPRTRLNRPYPFACAFNIQDALIR